MRSRHATIRRMLRPVLGRSRAVLRAALIVSLWHAPIPWVHFHDLDGHQVEELDPLAHHISEFHAGDVRLGRKTLDWHAHLVLPWAVTDHDACPGNETPAPRPDDVSPVMTPEATSLQSSMSLARHVPTLLADGGNASFDVAVTQQEVVASATIPACGWCRHFFETYGRTSAVRDLSGVRLC